MTTDTAETTVDVREISGAPFDDISAALDSLEPGQRFRLLVPFEPVPLYDVLDDRGFDYDSQQRDDGVWEVFVEHA